MSYIETISIGMPQTIILSGHKVHTAFLIYPVQGPIKIEKTGPVGNQPAVLPDAIYVMPFEHYEYWGVELGFDWKNWTHRHFGENFTTLGSTEEDIAFGDQFQIWDTLKVQVVSPRVPCTKLA